VRSLVTNGYRTDEQNRVAFADTSTSSQNSGEYGAKFSHQPHIRSSDSMRAVRKAALYGLASNCRSARPVIASPG
jgi:hypothetical protein